MSCVCTVWAEGKRMMTTNENAYAKLNISLDVTERREDGYHDMLMVMQTVSLCDEIAVTLDESGRVRARSNLRFIPGDERNLAVKAALYSLEETGHAGQGMLIEINKRIPVGAGMGGGSSDAAAVLRALNRLYGDVLDREQLRCLSERIGSDVPFCVYGGTALASGRGEKLEELPDMPDCRFIICKPEFSISTPELFRKLDEIKLRCHPDTAGLVEAIRQGQLAQISRRMYNVFEDVDDRRMRTVADIKSTLLDYGALGAVMTGTGSAVFGVFESDRDVSAVRDKLCAEYGFCESAACVGAL